MNKHFRKFLFFFLSFCLPAVAVLHAQELKFSHIGSDQGLSQAAANAIFQDRQGFMWFATQEGLNKYDGYSFTIYKNDPNDSNSIANGYLNSIVQDANGKYWIGTYGGGLDMFDDYTGKFTHYAHDEKNNNTISNNFVRTVFEDRSQQLWVGTEKGLNRLDKKTGKFRRYMYDSTNASGISHNIINTIFQDSRSRLWFGTQGGLALYDPASGKFTTYTVPVPVLTEIIADKSSIISVPEMASRTSRIRAIYEDTQGLLWLGTDGGGIIFFDPQKKSYVHHPGGILERTLPNRVFAITADNTGNVWLGTYSHGVYIYSPQNNTIENHKSNENNSYSLRHDEIKCILRDREGNMWVGAAVGAVNVHFRSMNKFTHIKKSERPSEGLDDESRKNNTLRSEVIMAVMEDRNGEVWVGTYGGGLTSINRSTGKYTHYKQLSTAAQDVILALLEDTDGNIWVATYGDGINKLDRKTGKITHYGAPAFMQEGTVLCLAEDTEKNIWFGTFDTGLHKLNTQTNQVTHYNTESGLSSNSIAMLHFDKKGRLWIASTGGGLMRMNTKTNEVKAFVNDKTNPRSLSNNFVNSICEDNKGRIWIATRNGLSLFNEADNSFRLWTEHDGLVNNYLYGILADSKGKIWISSNKGITSFDPEAVNENGSAFRNFGINDGLQRGEFNQGAFFKSKSGEFFFGGVYGLNMFFPDKINQTTGMPPVWITSYKRFGKEVALDTQITHKKYIELSWKDNYISFEFAALDYAMPQKNRYQYKLEGFDDDWSPPSSIRFASYTNLPGGTYTFRVRAANSEGVWNETGTSLRIRIIPPFWKTTWFYALSALIIIAGIFGFIRYRTGAIQKENKILEQRVEERTSELAQKNADITASIEYAKRIQSAMLPPLDQLFRHLPEAFVLYRPKDIVSGDFYWFGEKNNRKVIVAADCTGHGVPGALMSMIGHNLLNQIVLEKGITEPGKILTALNEGVRNALKQGHHRFEGEDTSDGMDICLCSIDDSKNEVQYAGALRPLVLVKKGVLTKIDSDRYPIGGHQDNNDLEYTTHTFTVEKTDTIYLFSDGYADQFGGPKGKKFMVKRMQDMLISIQGMNMQEQGTYLGKTITDWMGSMQQVDDILVIGIRF